MCGLFKSLLNLCTVPSGSFWSTDHIEERLSPGALDGDGDGAEEFGEVDLAREEAVEASKPGECTVGDFTLSKLKDGIVGFGDLTRWDGTREIGRRATCGFRGPVAAWDGRKDDMIEIHE